MKDNSEISAENPAPTEPAFTPLHAHDKVEGSSEAGRDAFRKLVGEMSVKQQSELDIRRSVKGEGSEVRRVTRDQIMKVFAAKSVSKEDQKIFWNEYFGGPPNSIAEFIRREIILHGNIRTYAEKVGLSHMTLMQIMNTRMLSFETLKALRHASVPFPWDKEQLFRQWRAMSCSYLAQRSLLNELGARVETLFQMRRPKVSRIQWVELDNAPMTLRHLSKSKRLQLMSRVRNGRPDSWEELDRVLVGMNCSQEERVEVAAAWLETHNKSQPDAVSGVRKKGVRSSDSDEEELPTEQRIPQSETPYPDHLVGQEPLAAIADLLTEFTGEAEIRDLAADEAALAARVQTILKNVDVIVGKKKEVRKPTDIQVRLKKRNPRPPVALTVDAPRIIENPARKIVDQSVPHVTITDEHRRIASIPRQYERIAALVAGTIEAKQETTPKITITNDHVRIAFALNQHERIASLLAGIIQVQQEIADAQKSQSESVVTHPEMPTDYMSDEEYYASLNPYMRWIARSVDMVLDAERESFLSSRRDAPGTQRHDNPYADGVLLRESEEARAYDAEVAYDRIHGDPKQRERTRRRALREVGHEPAEDDSENE